LVTIFSLLLYELDYGAWWRCSEVSQRHQVYQDHRTARIQTWVLFWFKSVFFKHGPDQNLSYGRRRRAYTGEGYWV